MFHNQKSWIVLKYYDKPILPEYRLYHTMGLAGYTMKIDRLLSIIVYLLNHDLISAAKLAERFGVSVRTIQRDMEAINLAGIPVLSVQGPAGGYGIMEGYKMDRRLVTVDDLFFIITALRSIGTSLDDHRIDDALEKMSGLLPSATNTDLKKRQDKLYVDFSMLGGGPAQREVFKIVYSAVERERLLKIVYTNLHLEQETRIVEPLSLVFKWRAWYLFAYCRLRGAFRLFRTSRIRAPEILDQGFSRREFSFDEFTKDLDPEWAGKLIDLKFKFAEKIVPLIQEFYNEEDLERLEDGGLIAKARLPEDGWLYGYILSFGSFIEVLEPSHIRNIIKNTSEEIQKIYE